MRLHARHPRWILLLGAAVAVCLCVSLSRVGAARAGSQSPSELNSQLGTNQSVQHDLAADVSSLESEISTLARQTSLVHDREQAVQRQLGDDEVQLADTQSSLTAERSRLAKLNRALRHAQMILSAQLVSSYEQPRQDLVAVVLNANGFDQMLDQLQFLKNAELSQREIIAFALQAKAAAIRSAQELRTLRGQQQATTASAETQLSALAGMNGLLVSRQTSLANLESARDTALTNAQAQGDRLRSALATVQAEQAAATRQAAAEAAAAKASAAAAQPTPPADASPSATSAAPSGGWTIPAAVVMCESGGQNLPPNRAGASGYYQIVPATWAGEGGSGPAAYLAPKSEQDAIAARLWNGGAGASNWVCASIVGIT